MLFTAFSSLTLEQVPRFRGTMMSITLAAMNTGGTLGAGVGGLALILYDYEFMGVSLGGMGLVGAAIFHLLVKDPTKT